MPSIRKILAPTDFSPYALEAFRKAHDLAKATGAVVMVLHVARSPAVVVDGGRLVTDSTGGKPNDLWDELRKMKADDPGVVVEHEVIVTERPDASHVLGIVEAIGCDLIVMGTRGLTGLKQRIFGSLTEEVVRQARCPVMVVKAPPTDPHVLEALAKGAGAGTTRQEQTSKWTTTTSSRPVEYPR